MSSAWVKPMRYSTPSSWGTRSLPPPIRPPYRPSYRQANWDRQTTHLMESDYHRLWTFATPKLDCRVSENSYWSIVSNYLLLQSDFLSSSNLGNTLSHVSGDVDRWIHGNGSASPTENTAVQGSRVAVTQRSTLVNSASLGCNTGSIWYMMAMILPMFNVQNCAHWRTCPSNFLAAAELLLRQLAGFCGLARNQLRRFAQDQLARDLFATLMDFVLVMYAMGFLVLSMYQASIIG
ncbi:hypothetical protein K1T71_006448 [Dendrolimus kikuchii]|uniref:Uncharacterized protein n=1 Tax=Dendrolimus kikuchii TaxID=765133 RepID=A0ACC1D1F6_9NEOP|nr:hypothetical protein K1T71_006448 [Dendrolimus kikuchii]